MKEKTYTTQFLELFNSYSDSFFNFVKINIANALTFLGIAIIATAALFIIRKILRLKKDITEESILLELTPPATTEKTAYTTQQLFSVLYDLGNQKTFPDKFLGRKARFSFEIVSTLDKGIRYIVGTTSTEGANVKRSIISYLPHVHVKTINEYLPNNLDTLKTKVIEFKLNKHFAYPLAKQNELEEHDPVAYITGMMTKLSPDELIAFQLVLSPTKKVETNKILRMILRNEDVLGYLNKPQLPSYILPFTFIFGLIIKLINVIGKEASWAITELAHPNTQSSYAYALQNQLKISNIRPARVLSTFEQEAVMAVQEKINQSLFEASIRILVAVNNDNNLKERQRGIKSSFGTFSVSKYQSLSAKHSFLLINKVRLLTFQKRLLSLLNNSSSTLLSVSEVADLYHFPYGNSAKTENIVTLHSKELPAPLSLKNGSKLDVIFGKNSYGGTHTDIGVSEEIRQTHTYILGRTGAGKTTLMYSMAKHDIENGRGLAFIDPHGNVSEDLLACIPLRRKDDLVYVNPIDLKYPIGINLLELTPGLDEDGAELEKEVVAEGVVSLFRHVFSKDDNANAHRIEYILRNTIYTAFTVKGCTIFTISKILTNPEFREQVIGKLQDEDLVDFWKYEFGKAGDFQVVKMTQGVTAKVGRFFRSPTAKRILEQDKSTISFDDIINNSKILICNFSQGKLGEDTSRLLGTTIMTKLQQAALKRAYLPEEERKSFYLYVDEFQNFATQSFTKMITEGRKYRMPLIIAEQSTSQQKDRDITNIILANVTTVISFRSGNYIDEDLMLNQFAPYLVKGEIMNLARYHFYIKISAIESEEPFSGETILAKTKIDKQKIQSLIEASRKNYAIVYQKPNSKKVPTDTKIMDQKKKGNIDNAETISVLS